MATATLKTIISTLPVLNQLSGMPLAPASAIAFANALRTLHPHVKAYNVAYNEALRANAVEQENGTFKHSDDESKIRFEDAVREIEAREVSFEKAPASVFGALSASVYLELDWFIDG